VDKKQPEAQADQFAYYALVSAGPDGKFGTADDIRLVTPTEAELVHLWWVEPGERKALLASYRGNELMDRLRLRNRRLGGS
jgi:hypothetical protein